MEYGSGGNLVVQMDGPFAGTGAGGGTEKIGTIHAPAADWKGAESPYSMAVGVDVVTVSSKVDVMLSAEQMVQFKDQIITFVAENNSGSVTLYAFGDKPKADIDLQVAVTETTGEGVILGSSVSTAAMRSDYAQTDPNKADFILNKPDAAITKAQATADTAKKTAEAALPKGGGEMTGSLDMGANSITNLADPTQDGDGVNKGYLVRYADSRILQATVQLTAAGWSAAAPYTQTVALSGILATDQPHYGVVYSGNWEAEKEAFSCVDDLDTAENALTFTCYEEKPQTNLTIQLEVNR